MRSESLRTFCLGPEICTFADDIIHEFLDTVFDLFANIFLIRCILLDIVIIIDGDVDAAFLLTLAAHGEMEISRAVFTGGNGASGSYISADFVADDVAACIDAALDLVTGHVASCVDIALYAVAGDAAAGADMTGYIVTIDIAFCGDIAFHRIAGNISAGMYITRNGIAINIAVGLHITRYIITGQVHRAVNIQGGALYSKVIFSCSGQLAI